LAGIIEEEEGATDIKGKDDQLILLQEIECRRSVQERFWEHGYEVRRVLK